MNLRRTMKSKLVLFALSLAALGLVQRTASAAVTAGDTITVSDLDGSPGGQFGVLEASILQFKTFCVQTLEFINPNGITPYYVASITTNSVVNNGIINPTGALNPATAYLFTEFFNNLDSVSPNIGGVVPLVGAGSAARNANALQAAIWDYQGQTYSAYDALTTGQKLAYKGVADAAVLGSWGSTTGNVYIMNLTAGSTAGGGNVQDLLIYVPPGADVPEPASFAVWAGLGLVGLAFGWRRRKS